MKNKLGTDARYDIKFFRHFQLNKFIKNCRIFSFILNGKGLERRKCFSRTYLTNGVHNTESKTSQSMNFMSLSIAQFTLTFV